MKGMALPAEGGRRCHQEWARSAISRPASSTCPTKGSKGKTIMVAGVDDDSATLKRPFNRHGVPAMQKFSLAPPTETGVLMERGFDRALRVARAADRMGPCRQRSASGVLPRHAVVVGALAAVRRRLGRQLHRISLGHARLRPVFEAAVTSG